MPCSCPTSGFANVSRWRTNANVQCASDLGRVSGRIAALSAPMFGAQVPMFDAQATWGTYQAILPCYQDSLWRANAVASLSFDREAKEPAFTDFECVFDRL